MANLRGIRVRFSTNVMIRPKTAAAFFAFSGILVSLLFSALWGWFYYSLGYEQYRRHAVFNTESLLPWETFVDQPLNWPALTQALSDLWIPITALAVTLGVLLVFALQVFQMARGRKPALSFGKAVGCLVISLILAAIYGLLTIEHPQSWFEPIPTKYMGTITSLTFLLVPLWILRAVKKQRSCITKK